MSRNANVCVSTFLGWFSGPRCCGSTGIQGPNMDPWPADHYVYDLHLWVLPDLEETPLQSLWKSKVHQINWCVEKNIFVILHRISKRQIIRYVHFLDDWSLFPYQVVCQSCSSHKHRLRYLKNQLARVCDQCFHVFQQQKSKIDFQTFYYMDRKLLYLLFIVNKKRRKKVCDTMGALFCV